jgi:hypothetical protein
MNPLIAAGKPNQPVLCNGCRYEFQQDPCFEVRCPECGAKTGKYCIRPSEHSGPFAPFHASRDLKALQEGFYDHPGNSNCGPNSNSEKAKTILHTKRSPRQSEKPSSTTIEEHHKERDQLILFT